MAEHEEGAVAVDIIGALNDIPAPVWTLAGGALGIAGTVWVERIRHKNDREDEERTYLRSQQKALEERMRDAYIDVLASARHFIDGTTYERSVLAFADRTTADAQIRSAKVLMEKLDTLDRAVLRASIESTEGMRGRLKAVRDAAHAEYEGLVPADSQEQRRKELKTQFEQAIDTLDASVHMLFAPELVYPEAGSRQGNEGDTGTRDS